MLVYKSTQKIYDVLKQHGDRSIDGGIELTSERKWRDEGGESNQLVHSMFRTREAKKSKKLRERKSILFLVKI